VSGRAGHTAETKQRQQQHCCSFEMIRASFQQDWASRGSFRYTWTTRHPKPACTEQGLLISVRSGSNARAAAVTHQSSRSALRRVPIGARPTPPGLPSTLVTLSATGHRRHGTVCPIGSAEHRRCSSSHAASIPLMAARSAYERPLRPPEAPKAHTPEQGRQGRKNSRCAGITR